MSRAARGVQTIVWSVKNIKILSMYLIVVLRCILRDARCRRTNWRVSELFASLVHFSI